MSRISRYQDSMGRFVKQRSCISGMNPEIKNKMDDIINNCDHVISILLLTVMNSQGKKINMNVHGYHIASGIEIMLYTTMINDNKEYYEKKLGKECVSEIINQMPGMVNLCLSHNIESIQDNYLNSNAKLLKTIYYTTRLINTNLYKLIKETSFEFESNITKTDAIKYKFEDMVKAINKIKKLKRIKQTSLDNYIQDRYGFICQLALINGWILGGGSSDDKNIPHLEKLGTCFGNMVKCVYDFINIENDLEYAKIYTTNTIINNGFQNSFEVFIENKQKFIEGCIKQNIYTNTVKEIIDLLESKLDIAIDKSSPDVKSHYTLTNE